MEEEDEVGEDDGRMKEEDGGGRIGWTTERIEEYDELERSRAGMGDREGGVLG